MKQTIVYVIIFLLVITFLATFLSIGYLGITGPQQEERKDLLIYCGITMIKPMSEIAEIIEEQENCKITITKGGSGNLLKSIKANNIGDLYLPGSDSYIETCLQEGLVTETVHVGFNKAAIMVQKGNPKNIPASLEAFLNESYHIHLGNPESGSIGKETKDIFQKKGIWEDVLENTCTLTTDSKDMHEDLKNKRIDLAINWYATSVWEENEPYMDSLPINEEYASKKRLVIGLLNTTKYPDIAMRFMNLAGSERGSAIFNKYGLYEIQ